MAKNPTAQQVHPAIRQATSKTKLSGEQIAITATVKMSCYINDQKEKVEFVEAVLHNPFEGEDFNASITPKWKDTKGVFDFKAKRVLKTSESFNISGRIATNTYFSKIKKREVSYPAIFVVDPFESDHEIEFAVKGEGNAAVFSMLVSARWQVQPEAEAVGVAQEG